MSEQQLGLFTPTPSRKPALPPIAAKADPPTSAKAAAELTRSGARQRQIDRVVELVRQWPGCTSLELSRLSGVDRHLIAKRLPDARGQGMVLVIADEHGRPVERCSEGSNRPAMQWVLK